MMVLITYDVCTLNNKGKTRLRKVAKQCQNYGQRVQNSVFETNISYADFIVLKDKLLKIIDDNEDSIRFYYLGKNWKRKIEHFGVKASYDSEDLLIV